MISILFLFLLMSTSVTPAERPDSPGGYLDFSFFLPEGNGITGDEFAELRQMIDEGELSKPRFSLLLRKALESIDAAILYNKHVNKNKKKRVAFDVDTTPEQLLEKWLNNHSLMKKIFTLSLSQEPYLLDIIKIAIRKDSDTRKYFFRDVLVKLHFPPDLFSIFQRYGIDFTLREEVLELLHNFKYTKFESLWEKRAEMKWRDKKRLFALAVWHKQKDAVRTFFIEETSSFSLSNGPPKGVSKVWGTTFLELVAKGINLVEDQVGKDAGMSFAESLLSINKSDEGRGLLFIAAVEQQLPQEFRDKVWGSEGINYNLMLNKRQNFLASLIELRFPVDTDKFRSLEQTVKDAALCAALKRGSGAADLVNRLKASGARKEAFHSAIDSSDWEVAELLLRHGAFVFDRSLNNAIEAGVPTEFFQQMVDRIDQESLSAYMIPAGAANNYEWIDILLDKGAVVPMPLLLKVLENKQAPLELINRMLDVTNNNEAGGQKALCLLQSRDSGDYTLVAKFLERVTYISGDALKYAVYHQVPDDLFFRMLTMLRPGDPEGIEQDIFNYAINEAKWHTVELLLNRGVLPLNRDLGLAISRQVPDNLLNTMIDKVGIERLGRSEYVLRAAVYNGQIDFLLNKGVRITTSFLGRLLKERSAPIPIDLVSRMIDAISDETLGEIDTLYYLLENDSANYDLTKKLLDKGFYSTNAALVRAIYREAPKSLLIRMIGAVDNNRDSYSHSLGLLLQRKDYDLAKSLMDKGANISDYCLAEAIESDASREFLIDMINRINIPQSSNEKKLNSPSRSLIALADRGDSDLIEKILDKGFYVRGDTLESVIFREASDPIATRMIESIEVTFSHVKYKRALELLKERGREDLAKQLTRKGNESEKKKLLRDTYIITSMFAALFIIPYAAHYAEYFYRYYRLKKAWRKKNRRRPNSQERDELKSQALKECSFKHNHKIVRTIQVVGSLFSLTAIMHTYKQSTGLL